MTEDDMINLQKLIGRDAQPWSLPPTEPDHLLAARVMKERWPELADLPGPTEDQLMMAEAIRRSGDSRGSGSAIPGQPAGLQYASYEAPSSVLPPMRYDAGRAYAMGSPANVDLPWQRMADANTAVPPPTPKPAPGPPPSPSSAQTSIDPIPGYDETGDNAWRSANDQIFLDAVNRYNAANGYRPGDDGYWTADMLKAQAMVESGGNRKVFMTDPLQVNTPRNWDNKKHTLAGLVRGQQMTPELSADAALRWLQYKGWMQNKAGDRGYIGDEGALWRYAGDPTPRSKFSGDSWDDGLTQQDWYASTIPQLARQAADARASNSRKP